MKKLFLLFVLLVSAIAYSQTINDYQYVIVPIKFDFLKENDNYRLNTLTKLLLQKYSFKSYLSNEEMPAEMTNNRCSILYASLVENNNFFVTKVKVVLKDCKETIVFETEFGTSRSKEYAPAYNEALREAFKSFDKLNYKYNGESDIVVKAASVKPSIDISEKLANQVYSLDITKSNSETFFFAQPTANGFQVVDNEPKVIMKLYTTSQKNVFLGIRGAINGVVISKENQWFFEYYENGKMVSEILKLKF